MKHLKNESHILAEFFLAERVINTTTLFDHFLEDFEHLYYIANNWS